MALTTIKTGGLADNSVTDAKVADAITVTGAQTGITQVGTLTAGTWNGTAIASAYLDADTAHLSGTQTFSGAKTFTADIQITEAHPQIGFTDSDDNSDSRIYHSAGSLYIDADRNNEVGSSKVRFSVDDSEVLNITTSTATFAGNITVNGTGSDIITGDYLYLDAADNSGAKNLVFRSLNDTWLGQIEFHPSSTAQIVTRVAQPLALGANNTQILKLRHETNQWGAEITSQSPYGLHVHTTGTSSGHDAFKVSRHDDAIIFQVFADANTINKNALTVQGTGTSSFAGAVNVTNMVEVTIPDISTGENKGLSLKNTSSGTTQQWNITTGITGQENDSFCVRDATNNLNAFTMTHTSGNANFAGNVHVHGYIKVETATPLWFLNTGSGTYNKSVVYDGQNNSSHNDSNGIFWERARLTDSSSAEVRKFVIGDRGGGKQFILNNSGGLWIAGALIQNSDIRLKTDIVNLDKATDIISKLQPFHYKWNDKYKEITGASTTQKQIGLDSIEVKKVLPQAVSQEVSDKEGEKYDTVDYVMLVPVLIQALNESNKRIKALENA